MKETDYQVMKYKSGAYTGGIIHVCIKNKTFMTMEKQADTFKKNGKSK